ncbi:MAG: hypothetical protein NZ926_02590 [Candidatus Methanomethylicia archaeon]|nr:hypothetical protein [Candidatus Methanomethylicia archaeon]MCX8169198.1 hypothetical protein [Candidatus Methanomethylicia archaeon]MDW7989020.1 hypothetical protein [Nitrososphaerota archaeon]
MKNLKLEELIHLVSFTNTQILFFGNSSIALINILPKFTCEKLLFVLEQPFPLYNFSNYEQYILECDVFNPWDIFKFKDMVKIIIYLPRFPSIKHYNHKTCGKLSYKIFIDKIQFILKVLKLLSLRLFLIFKGGIISFDPKPYIHPYFINYIISLFDLAIYCDDGFTLVKSLYETGL